MLGAGAIPSGRREGARSFLTRRGCAWLPVLCL